MELMLLLVFAVIGCLTYIKSSQFDTKLSQIVRKIGYLIIFAVAMVNLQASGFYVLFGVLKLLVVWIVFNGIVIIFFLKPFLSAMVPKIIYASTPLAYPDKNVMRTMQFLLAHLEDDGFTVADPHVVSDDPARQLAFALNKHPAEVTPSDVERYDMAKLITAGIVLAEVTYPSTGVGREIEIGWKKQRLGFGPSHVVCIYRTDKEQTVSKMIRGMDSGRYQNVHIIAYTDDSDALDQVKQCLAAITFAQ